MRTWINKDGTTGVGYYHTRLYNERYRAVGVEIDRGAKLEAGGCVDCGLVATVDNLVVFDWDHRDPREKVTNVSAMLRTSAKPGQAEAIRAEIAKCDLRCSNCHRLRTARERHAGLPRHAGWREGLPDLDDTLF